MRRARAERRIKGGGTAISGLLIYLMLILIALAMVLPFIHELAKSFSYPSEVDAGRVSLWPRKPTLGNYYYYYRKHFVPLSRSFGITIYITGFGTLWSIYMTTLMAYPLSRSRKEFKFGPVAMGIAIFSIIMFPPIIPYFLAIRSYGLMDTLWSIIITHTIVPFHLILLVAFFRQLPEDLFDSCRIDGGSDWRILFQIVLPLSKAVLATVAIFTAIILWNIFLHPLLFINNPKKFPLQIFLRSIFQGGADPEVLLQRDPFDNTESIKSALVILTTIPIVLVYPLLQKHFIKGMMLGALKE